MKKFIITALMASLLVYKTSAQGMPVYDNTNFISLTKSLIESAKQTGELLKTVQFLKEQKERIEKVAGVIRQLKAVRELVRNHQKSVQLVRRDLRDILNSEFIKPEEAEQIASSFQTIIDLAKDDLDFVNEILASNHFRMTDGERAAILKEKEKKSRQIVAELETKKKRYTEIISFREMQNRLRRRRTGY
jgi:DNA repair ATPase RecN